MAGPDSRSLLRLGAAVGLSASFGTIHAFSVLLEPLETRLGTSRGATSALYSTALIALTLAVFGFGRARPAARLAWWVPVAAAAVGSAGLGLAAGSTTWVGAVAGYGVLFGAANGVAYAYALELGPTALPDRPGFAMGITTAAYASGATGAAVVFALALDDGHGVVAVVGALALVVAAAGVVAAAVLRVTAPRREPAPSSAGPDPSPTRGTVLRSFATYGLAVVAGLMTLGHAAEMLEELDPGAGARAAAVIAAANAVGGVGAAIVSDRIGARGLLTGLSVTATASLLALAAAPSAGVGTFAIGLVGFAYGAVIAVYPHVVRSRHGAAAYPEVYGRVFLAWGAAGFAGPLLAGSLFDATGSYRLPMLVAALASAGAAALAFTDSGGGGGGQREAEPGPSR